jgi:hypothetical protein
MRCRNGLGPGHSFVLEEKAAHAMVEGEETGVGWMDSMVLENETAQHGDGWRGELTIKSRMIQKMASEPL